MISGSNTTHGLSTCWILTTFYEKGATTNILQVRRLQLRTEKTSQGQLSDSLLFKHKVAWLQSQVLYLIIDYRTNKQTRMFTVTTGKKISLELYCYAFRVITPNLYAEMGMECVNQL